MIGKYNDGIIALPTSDDIGCWIDGHWGQYAIARLVGIAEAFGWQDVPGSQVIDIARRMLASETISEVTADEYQHMYDAADEVEQWLNDNVAPKGHVFFWHDGEFFLDRASDFEEDA